ncbi:MAG: tRNA (adenosine(37)-N6)-dimethylallyltransferase MiaA [Bacteroidetes bacterium]|nr:MAG: tRNA (adenosine(37)-N6)-dimethylallyltransferase MiaA [Bacteroidota bacterium]
MPTLIVIAGPTASGKTSLAIRLAKYFSSEIISADSRQFYKGLDIGTAKPTKEQLSSVRHHFIDSHEISDPYNISDYETDALKKIEELFLKNEVVFLVGGSGLYIRAICHGINEIPGRDESIREKLIEMLDTYGIQALQNKIKELDAEYYNEVDLNNPHRLIRALEVCISSGQKYSSLRQAEIAPRPFNIIKIGLLLDREELYSRVENRVDEMISDGLVDEARSLLPFRNANALNTVGYKELFEFFDNNCTLEQAIDAIKKNTRNYAKRQMTWFRKEEGIKWFDPEDTKLIIKYLEDELSK